MKSNTVWSYEFEKDKQLGAGQLLLSEPFMPDENFRRTVVLICEHSQTNGVVGLILNKLVNLRLKDVLDGLDDSKAKLHLGGPVGTDTLQYLHRQGAEVEGSVKLAENLYWGGDFDQIKAMLRTGELTEHDIQFYLGYSGWTAAQLVEELKENSWIIAEGNQSHVFETSPEQLWKKIMNELGGIYATMANYPENPALN